MSKIEIHDIKELIESNYPPAIVEKMINEDHHAEAVCQFCGKKYEFSEQELKDIYDKMDQEESK